MDVLQTKSNADLFRVLLEEQAKATSELRSALDTIENSNNFTQASVINDLKKTGKRLSFSLVITNILINRQGD